jgi:hypothetical protein
MTVTFQSELPEAACVLFELAFEHVAMQQSSTTGPLKHYIFEDDMLIRDVRSWCADAFGCGLVSMSAVTVHY